MKGVTVDREAIRTIEEILRRGNDAKVRRKGDGCVVVEVRETIQYRCDLPPIGAAEGQ